ncbi:MAG TPA: hypothetical protein VE377_03070 [Candidatus Dormibacteraeota bacterium]|nr:hypothetical protein [Candidatus Dormibacteraeota bacterium]
MRGKALVFASLASLLWLSGSSRAANVNAASCSQSNVQSAINAASSGDTVVVPSGSCTYTTATSYTASVIINKAITVQGQTACTGAGSSLSCTDGTIISDGTGTNSGEIPFEISSSGARLTGFSFVDTRSVVDAKSAVQTDAGTTGWRIDHNHFHPTNTNNTRAITAYGYGLVDHNYFQDALDGVDVEGGQSGDTTYAGDASWTQAMSFGTANAVYIEDNEFNYTQVLDGAYDSYAGARVVFRYNDVKNTNFGSHGLDSGGLRSTLQQEIYGNTVSNTGTHIYTMANTRGGVAFIFNNVVSASGGSYDSFYWVQNYRSDSAYSSSWGACDGSNNLDQNSSGWQGWGCKDQVGRGTNQGKFPQYSWGNSFKGRAPTIASNFYICGYQDCTRAQTYHILNNRDIYNEVSGFDGTSGVGFGPMSARPSSCTSGVGYFATDQGVQGTLYQCSSANAWTSYYVPYTYPHPLQNSGGNQGPAPPTGLTATVI